MVKFAVLRRLRTTAEHSVLDEEPLNSAEYAQRSEPFRSDRGLGERRE